MVHFLKEGIIVEALHDKFWRILFQIVQTTEYIYGKINLLLKLGGSFSD